MRKVIFNKPIENVIDYSALDKLDTIIVVDIEKSLTFMTDSVKAKFNSTVLGLIIYSVNIKDKPFEKGYTYILNNNEELSNVLNGETQFEYRNEIFDLLKQISTVEYYVISGK